MPNLSTGARPWSVRTNDELQALLKLWPNATLKFSQNWNNKLACPIFTTIRHGIKPYHFKPDTYCLVLDIQNTDDEMAPYAYVCKVLTHRTQVQPSALPNELCYTDAGMCRDDLMDYLNSIYELRNIYDSGWRAMPCLTILTLQQEPNADPFDFALKPNRQTDAS